MAEPTIKIVHAVTLDGTETVKWDEGGGTITATLDAGTYWCHNDTTVTDYPSLYDHIITKMNALAGGGYTYQINDATPTASSAWPHFGIVISTTNPGLSWTWDASGTINALEVLGWRTTDGTTAATLGTVTSPRCYRGAWRSPDRAPSLWTSRPARLVTPSTSIVERTDAYFFDQGARRLRTIKVEYVTAAHVYGYRADIAAFATLGELATTDDNNALEWTWTHMAKGGKALLVWYDDADDLDLLLDGNGYYEVVRMADPGQMQDMGEILNLIRAGGEVYTIAIDFARADENNYTWNQ